MSSFGFHGEHPSDPLTQPIKKNLKKALSKASSSSTSFNNGSMSLLQNPSSKTQQQPRKASRSNDRSQQAQNQQQPMMNSNPFASSFQQQQQNHQNQQQFNSLPAAPFSSGFPKPVSNTPIQIQQPQPFQTLQTNSSNAPLVDDTFANKVNSWNERKRTKASQQAAAVAPSVQFNLEPQFQQNQFQTQQQQPNLQQQQRQDNFTIYKTDDHDSPTQQPHQAPQVMTIPSSLESKLQQLSSNIVQKPAQSFQSTNQPATVDMETFNKLFNQQETKMQLLMDQLTKNVDTVKSEFTTLRRKLESNGQLDPASSLNTVQKHIQQIVTEHSVLKNHISSLEVTLKSLNSSLDEMKKAATDVVTDAVLQENLTNIEEQIVNVEQAVDTKMTNLYEEMKRAIQDISESSHFIYGICVQPQVPIYEAADLQNSNKILDCKQDEKLLLYYPMIQQEDATVWMKTKRVTPDGTLTVGYVPILKTEGKEKVAYVGKFSI